MAKIQGHYFISAPLYTSGDNTNRALYTYTNADRAASIGFPNECKLSFSQLDPQAPGGLGAPVREFFCNVKAVIKRARLFTPGSPGVHGAKDTIAAAIQLWPYCYDGLTETDAANVLQLRFTDYNEWQEFGTAIEAFELAKLWPRYNLRIKAGSPSVLTVDDYNLQSAYEGESLYAMLQMEIDTAGMWDPYLGALV